MHGFKKQNKGKSSSPQGRHSIGATSAAAPSNLLTFDVRPRSSSNASYTNASGVMQAPSNNVLPSVVKSDAEAYPSLSNNDRNTATETHVKANGTANLGSGGFLPETPVQISGQNLLASDGLGVSSDVDAASGVSDLQKNRQLMEQLKQKIIKTSEAIKAEQASRDENVAEYLKLATNADKQQASRIKSVFEKKNQKSKATIQQLQRKLDSYHRKLKDLETNGSGKQGRFRDNFRDFSGGVVDSVKGGLFGLQHATQNAAGAIVNKPRDLAFRIKHRFGSSDNLPVLKDDDGNPTNDDDNVPLDNIDDVSSASGSIDNFNSFSWEGATGHENIAILRQSSSASFPESPNSGINRRVNAQQLQEVASQLLTIKSELQEMRKFQARMETDWESRKDILQNSMTSMLDEEKVRNEDQLNDLTELHQREIANLRQELASLEEKVEYHAKERARDMQETIESCKDRIAKIELQQQQQQSLTVEGVENATARALIGKLINLLLSVMAVILILVSTVTGILRPFIKSLGRIFATMVVITAAAVTYRHWNVVLSWYTAFINSR